jgi:hypothetical protein
MTEIPTNYEFFKNILVVVIQWPNHKWLGAFKALNNQIAAQSQIKPVAIFKHSITKWAEWLWKRSLRMSLTFQKVTPFLDLIAFEMFLMRLLPRFGVTHHTTTIDFWFKMVRRYTMFLSDIDGENWELNYSCNN